MKGKNGRKNQDKKGCSPLYIVIIVYSSLSEIYMFY